MRMRVLEIGPNVAHGAYVAMPAPLSATPGVTTPDGELATVRKEKGAASLQPLMSLARPEGFEPPTPWFVARYSIQMSYGRCEGRII